LRLKTPSCLSKTWRTVLHIVQGDMSWRWLIFAIALAAEGEVCEESQHLQLVQRQLQLLRGRGATRTWEEARSMAAATVDKLRDDELFDLVRGSHFAVTGSPDPGFYVGNMKGIPEHNIPSLKMQDAAQGFRATEPGTGGTTTAWPCMLALASTWDEALVNLVAAAIGTEFKGKGANVILGPSVNVHRAAAGGRNFEYLSGEDGTLGARLTAAYVKGVQDQGVIATAKHFAGNEQETARMSMSAQVSDRTMWELYYKPFRAAAEVGLGAVMCAYNKVNGTYACHNSKLLTKDLRGTMGFSGFVMSDWLATHVPDLEAGLDQEQPGMIQVAGKNFGVLVDSALKAVDRHVVKKASQHILTSIYRFRLDQNRGCEPPQCAQALQSDQTKATTRGERHEDIALRSAQSAITLLKNEGGLLPLSKKKRKLDRIAVVGNAAADEFHNFFVGKGSGFVQPDSSAKTPLHAIEERALKAGVQVVKPEGISTEEAASLAKSVDAVIVVLGVDATEGADRASLGMGNASDAMVRAVAQHAPTIVLLEIPGAVLMPWREEVPCIASLFMGGVATGTAWANFLFGDAAPRGRLPIMMPATMDDVIPVAESGDAEYSEGLLTSYRSPTFKAAFPFGHGLAFTTFKYGDAHRVECSAALCVAVNVTNVGEHPGEEVVQAYVNFPEPVGGDDQWKQRTPALLLKNFKHTTALKPSETQLIQIDFAPEDFKLYSSMGGWVSQKKANILLGASSHAIHSTLSVDLS